MNSTVISVKNLTRRFGDKIAVNDLSVEVQAGEVFGFLGHNGAGKTTTIRMINGVLDPNSGSIRVLDMDPFTEGPALRSHTGVMTESAAVEMRLTARDNLKFFADLFGVPKDEVQPRLDKLLDFFGLSDYADQRAETFSTGMRQRLALARTLIHDPEVIFLDEPTNGLDPVAAHQVHDLISNLAKEKGRTVFLCTHNLLEAQKLCHRVAVLEHGKLVAIGTPTELIQQYIRRLDVDIETAPGQLDTALQVCSSASSLTLGLPHRVNGGFTLTVTGRDAIPELTNLLVKNHIRLYQIAAHEPTLEDVYFELHGNQETKL